MVEASSTVLTLDRALAQVEQPLWVRGRAPHYEVVELDPAGAEGEVLAGSVEVDQAYIPACPLENLGDPGFAAELGCRYACMSGAMANGIGSVELAASMARRGFLGIFGAAGLPLAEVELAIDRLDRELDPELPRGFNLIHSPGETGLEEAVVELYLRRGVRLVEASAYLKLTPSVVRYRATGLTVDPQGRIVAPNRIIAKVSRVEVASRFMAPPPESLLAELVLAGKITRREAELAGRIPVAELITAEADSGGHTDNQPALALLPTLLALRDALAAQHAHGRPIRVGAAGGIATPWAAAAAFAMGAAYVVTGSINQGCVEAGTSELVRQMLAQARQADFAMAPAADMFEMGVKVQVLKRGTLFPMRATRLYELYRQYDSLDQIPAAERANLEKNLFRLPLEQIWDQTREYFAARDPGRIERAAQDPKKKMALVFRWYLGMSSQWANAGVPDRTVDYQIWCGPAMAAFNDWVRGTTLESVKNRSAPVLARAILRGAATLARAQAARMQGIRLPAGVPRLVPHDPSTIEKAPLFP